MNMKRIRYLNRSLLIAGAVLIGYLLFQAACVWLFSYRDETGPADAAVVLGAAAYESGPSPVYRERLNHGIELYRRGYVRKLILTGGTAPGNLRSDAAIGAAYVMEQGVPQEDILLEELSVITEENLRNSAEIMDREGLYTCLVVSDPLHMKRAMLMAGDAGLTAFSSPTATSMIRSAGTKTRFFLREFVLYVGYRWVRLFR